MVEVVHTHEVGSVVLGGGAPETVAERGLRGAVGRLWREAAKPVESEFRGEVARVRVRRLAHYPADWALPEYATPGSAAVDLRNAGPAVTLGPGARVLVPTGLAIALPAGMEAQVRPRSGLAIRRGIGLINSPGTIDSDYRGEVQIPLINHDPGPQEIAHGERVAQLVLARVLQIGWEEVQQLPETERGTGGFGSTGR